MNLWKSMSSYPTQEDLVYELCSYLEKDGRPGGEFTLQTFNSIWGSKWMETKHYELVQQMLNDGFFTESSGQGSNKVKYKIKDTPGYV